MAVKLGDIHIISCYISPNILNNDYEDFLDELTDCVRVLPGKILIGGDFNALGLSTY